MLKDIMIYLQEEQDVITKEYSELERDLLEYQEQLHEYHKNQSISEYDELVEKKHSLTTQIEQFKEKYYEYKEMEQLI